MKRIQLIPVLVLGFSYQCPLWALGAQKVLVVELDPLAPLQAYYDQSIKQGVSSNQWAGRVDFNVQGIFSTGPEMQVGSYVKRGVESNVNSVRREDLWPGEHQKIGLSRFRWNISFWEIPETMRGWFVTAGYEYARIDSKANRYTEGPGDAVPVGAPIDVPDDETDLVTDIRHGVRLAFGERWVFANKYTTSLELSLHRMTRREVSVTSKDSLARADYDASVEELRIFPATARSYPEAKLGIGYAF